MEEPKIVKGNIFVDDRGLLTCVNGFDMVNIRRFYIVQNHRQGFIRGFHAHKLESKYAIVLQGSVLVCVVRITNWKKPSQKEKIHKFVLNHTIPCILYIPAGYANAFMSLTQNAEIMFFSTSTPNENKQDDYRFPAHYWNCWDILER